MLRIGLQNGAFALHAIIETAAGIDFILHPERQLPGCTAAAKLILRQYGSLLLASSAICVIVLVDSAGFNTATTRLLAVALGSYHAWPCYRAWVRIQSEAQSKAEKTSMFRNPYFHLLDHVVCLGLFIYTALMTPP